MQFPGIIPAITTPFDPGGGDVDLDALGQTVNWLLDSGVHGVVAAGSMGEASTLTPAERRQVIEATVEAVDGRVPVTAGVSAEAPPVAGGYATDAAAAGADAVMCLPPLGYRGDEREIERHFATVAAAVELPIIAYNNPPASGTDMSPELLARLGERIEQVVAVKECSSDVRRIPAILAESDGALEVLVGGDDWALEGFCAGATGWISGVADVVPEACCSLYDRCMAGDLDVARDLYRRLLPLARFDMTPKLVQYYKAGMDAAGQAGGPCRLPRLPLTEAEQADLEAALSLATDIREKPQPV